MPETMAARTGRKYLHTRTKAKTTLGNIISLDGRTLEGGGQLLRIALCLATLNRTPVRIHDIRGNRSGGGGLKAQHLACVDWLAHACNAKVEGAEKGSKTLLFEPGEVHGLSPAFTKRVAKDGGRQVYEAHLDIGTAGSTALALQAVLPFILFTKLPSHLPIRLTVTGGTNVSGSPSYEYITLVLIPTLHHIGFPEIKAVLGKRGWSHGGASIGNFTLEIPPRASTILPAFRLMPAGGVDKPQLPKKPTRLQAIFIAPTSCHEHFCKVLVPAVQYHLGPTFTPSSSDTGSGDAPSGAIALTITCEGSLNEKCMYLIIIATVPCGSSSLVVTDPTVSSPPQQNQYTIARDWLYDRRIRLLERTATEMAERVTSELATEWRSGAYIDEHMRDQVVIFQALARGRSEVYPGVEDSDDEEESKALGLREPSLHSRTAEWVAMQMLPGVSFDAEGGCEGIGFGEDKEEDEALTRGKDGDLVKQVQGLQLE